MAELSFYVGVIGNIIILFSLDLNYHCTSKDYIHTHDHRFIYIIKAELVVYMINAGNVISVLVFLSPV